MGIELALFRGEGGHTMIPTGTLLDLTAVLVPAASAATGFVLVVLATIVFAAIRERDVEPPPAASAVKASAEKVQAAA